MARVGEVFEIQQGKALSAAARTATNTYAFLRTINVHWNRIDLTKVDRMGMSDSERARLNLQSGDLLVCEGGEIGRAAVWKGELSECSFQNHIHRLRPKTQIEPAFFAYWFRYAFTMTNLYEGTGTQTTIANLSSGRLGALQIPVPSFDEQQQIARILSTIVQLESQTATSLARKRELADSVIDAVLEEERHASHIRPLVELTAENRPICYGILKPGPDIADGVPYIRVVDYPQNLIKADGVRRTSREIAQQYRRSVLQTGDVLISIRGTFGRVAHVPPQLDGANITQDTARISVSPNHNARFVYHYLSSRPAQRFMRESAVGVAVKGVNIGDLRQMPIPVPPRERQDKLVGVMDAVTASVRAEEDSLAATKSLLAAAMASFFRKLET
jgi:type I restriction enzyme S subunit